MGAQDSGQSWHELPFWTLVKNYAKIAVVFYGLGWILTRCANLDLLILSIQLQNLWLIVPEGVITLGTFYLWNWSRQSEKKKRQHKAKRDLQTLLKEAQGGEQKK